ncbi:MULTISPECIES: hypothetical protein [Enterococcus]|uniref:hypothetical protein n=1 Tax=Enterococcus TaxID=1350 RepID=UPI0001B2BF7C|nr:hypothetical protein [Enterococcus faecalis]KLL25729.1 hypothetical protein WA34_09715 [Streptococcus agalactiae]EEU72329.1 predicted protein [Enterococcus faecalis HIP11704]EFM79313.1 hypothetical protein HMPREF9514_02070 [Enterococcus faecalis TX0855]EGO2744470.1 hypothetical protein [Enterococcus faecalis]EGO6522935.1 hypothetical protein [Enterococcus faecalis]
MRESDFSRIQFYPNYGKIKTEVKTMKITLTRKTSAWGALRYFTFYKNGVHQGKLFTNVPIEIEADHGDVLTFYEGWFQFYRRIEVTEDTKEITIINSKKLQHVFYTCVVLFLILTLLFLSAQKLSTFIIAEILIYSGIQWLFRQQTYHFTVKKKTESFASYSKKSIAH